MKAIVADGLWECYKSYPVKEPRMEWDIGHWTRVICELSKHLSSWRPWKIYKTLNTTPRSTDSKAIVGASRMKVIRQYLASLDPPTHGKRPSWNSFVSPSFLYNYAS